MTQPKSDQYVSHIMAALQDPDYGSLWNVLWTLGDLCDDHVQHLTPSSPNTEAARQQRDFTRLRELLYAVAEYARQREPLSW